MHICTTHLSLFVLVFACIVTTSFPIMYLFVPWYKTQYGRALMFQSAALALAIDLTLVFNLVPVDHVIGEIIEIFVFLLIAFAAANKGRLLVQTYREDMSAVRKKESETGVVK